MSARTATAPKRRRPALRVGDLAVFGPVPVLVCVLIGMISIERYLERQVTASIRDAVLARAPVWAEDFARVTPELPVIAATGVISDYQKTLIDRLPLANEIFGLVIHAPDGEVQFASERGAVEPGRLARQSSAARRVAETGKPNVRVFDGRVEVDRPNDYVEVYVPTRGPTDELEAVLGFHVDVSAQRHTIEVAFARLSVQIVLGTAIVVAIPAALALRRSRQIRAKDRHLREMAQRDRLTGVLNRQTFTDRLEELLDDPRRRSSVAVFFVDIDHFKEINDNHGHAQGDAILAHVAATIGKVLRSGQDIVGRYGGDEFVVACPELEPARARSLADDIQARIRTPFDGGAVTVTPSLSIGMHLSPPGEGSEAALHAADLALYQAKEQGRNCTVAYTADLEASYQRRKFIEDCLARGVEEGLFKIAWQPIFRAEDCGLAGFEALMRLCDPECCDIGPQEFIPVAEETGHIEAMGDWILGAAMEEAASWPDPVYVSINLSSAQFSRGTLARRTEELLARTGLPAERLMLEITETLLFSSDRDASSQLADLKALGVSIAMDDFGSGYSSLGYIWKFDFDTIKIDRSFLEGFAFDPDRMGKVLETIVAIGREMELRVVAEGVENAEQLERVTQIGVDLVQGFHLARPMESDEMRALIARHLSPARQRA